eukprot:178680_1
MGKKETEAVEPDPSEEPTPEVEEPQDTRTTFEKLDDDVWTLSSLEEQRIKLAEVLDIPDSQELSSDQIICDIIFHGLIFARQLKFSRKQSEVFYDSIQQLLSTIKDSNRPTPEECLERFKEIVVARSVFAPPPPPPTEEELAEQKKREEEETDKNEAKKKGKGKRASKKDVAAEAEQYRLKMEADEKAKQEEAERKLFSKDNIKQIMQFASTIFSAFHLHRAAFIDAEDEPVKKMSDGGDKTTEAGENEDQSKEHHESMRSGEPTKDELAEVDAVKKEIDSTTDNEVQSEEDRGDKSQNLNDLETESGTPTSVRKLIDQRVESLKDDLVRKLEENRALFEKKLEDLKIK